MIEACLLIDTTAPRHPPSPAAQWVRAAGATYSGYVELRIARDFGDVP